MGALDEHKVSDSSASSIPQEAQTIVNEKYADVTLRILEDHGDEFGPLTPEKETKLRRKLYWHVMGLLSAINLLLFVCCVQDAMSIIFADLFQIDKSTLGYSALLGLFEETGIDKAQYNNLGTFFYVGTQQLEPFLHRSFLMSSRIYRRAVARTLCHAKASIRQIRRWARLHVGCHPPPSLRRHKIRRSGGPATGPRGS